ncbi:MAG: bifunctional UDP-N-acetylglucosamine diphosphorylase/glucosamine-1-phosphate N-acetyltransferase GlmU [Gammaproteobacteria bacterium]
MKNQPLEIVILAAGLGKRMYSCLPKVLYPIGGVPMIVRVVDTAEQLQPQAIHIVHNSNGDQLKEKLNRRNVSWVPQADQLGSAHALLQALPSIADDHQVLILFADVPLISVTTLHNLSQATKRDDLGVLLAEFSNPHGLGRVIRDSDEQITAIVEEKDATDTQRAIKERFTGIMLASAQQLKQWLPTIGNRNAQGEYYLTEVVGLAAAEKNKIIGVRAACPQEVQGVNDRVQLIALERAYQRRAAHQLLLAGVTIIDPDRFDLRGELNCAQDVTIDINVIIEGQVSLGENTTIGANCIVRNSKIGCNVTIKAKSIIEDAEIAEGCIIGPYARLRPQTQLAQNVHIGNYVEIKKSKIGAGTKINHLSYIGDAIIGEAVNIGAGTITCNYDGVHKHQTIIEDGVFIGSDTQLIAPVTVGAGATIGAGATVRKNAPAGKLTLNETCQTTIEDWQRPE